jgi:hypothetical protein
MLRGSACMCVAAIEKVPYILLHRDMCTMQAQTGLPAQHC